MPKRRTPKNLRWDGSPGLAGRLVEAPLRFDWEKNPTKHSCYCEQHKRTTTDIIGCVESGIAFRCRPPHLTPDEGHTIIKPYKKPEGGTENESG